MKDREISTTKSRLQDMSMRTTSPMNPAFEKRLTAKKEASDGDNNPGSKDRARDFETPIQSKFYLRITSESP